MDTYTMQLVRCEDLLADILAKTHRGHAKYTQARDLYTRAENSALKLMNAHQNCLDNQVQHYLEQSMSNAENELKQIQQSLSEELDDRYTEI